MSFVAKGSKSLVLLGALALPMSAAISAQEMPAADSEGEVLTTVYGSPPADLEGLAAGPEIEGFISARNEGAMQVTTVGGTKSVVMLSDGTEIRSSGGFLGLNRDQLGQGQLLNGLPVTVETVRWNNGLVASKIALKSKDLKTAAMIASGTDQRFGEQGQRIDQNKAATEANAAAAEALRGRFGDIDKYNIKGTTNVYFDTARWNLKPGAGDSLCEAAAEAEAMDNALLLVVGYTDSVGNEDYNQELSEKRAGRVVNYLQQKCKWAPWRMLTPTGMSESDPTADNSTAEGRAQNRRVAVNILVSKSVDGI